MTNKFGLSFLIVLATTAAHAAPQAPLSTPAETTNNVTIVKKPINTVMEGSSEHNRMGINHQLLLGTGYSVSPIPSTSLAYAYQFDRKNAIHVEASSGLYPFLFFTKVKTATAGLHYKRYVGNSFYFRTGLDTRTIILEDNGLWSTAAGREYGRTTDLTAAFVIGNQWQWENFTLGTDWIGVNTPIANMDQKFDRSGLSASDSEDVRVSWTRLGRVTSYQLLRFYLGASF
jgi:hypothetical protein